MIFSRITLARILIGFVLLINIQCALYFIIFPSNFAPAYELTGIPGNAAVQGFAILFIMWNVPYAFAFINPIRYKISLFEAIIMQSIGLAGESLLWFSIPSEFVILRKSILRFILFDGGGLIALLSALMITNSISTIIFTEVN
jgi:hypothetical protein